MYSTVLMPRNGQSVESCIITRWFKKKGDAVKKGEIIFSYETDKATFDYESEFDGSILDVYFNEGDDVPVLTAVCIIGDNADTALRPTVEAKTSSESKKDSLVYTIARDISAGEGEEKHEDDMMSDSEKRIKISPRAKVLAKKMNIDYSSILHSGPNGRIVEKDIIALNKRANSTSSNENKQTGEKIEEVEKLESEDQEVKTLSHIRRIIAEKMLKSLSTTAQLTLNTSFDATDILEFRKRVNERGDILQLKKITINDIILYAVSRTILNYKDLNAYLIDNKITYFKNVNLGVAVDNKKGLLVPTIFNANKKSLNDISGEVKNLVEKCRNDSITPDLLQDATFTVSNLGMLGIESFTPIINPPQTAILGVCSMITKFKEKKGTLTPYPAIGLSLTFDHRALDGAKAAKFLKELKNLLEDFSINLVK